MTSSQQSIKASSTCSLLVSTIGNRSKRRAHCNCDDDYNDYGNNNYNTRKQQQQQQQQSSSEFEIVTKMERITNKILNQLDRNSTFFDQNPPSNLPKYTINEIQLSNELGRGEFGIVMEVSKFNIQTTTTTTTNEATAATTIETTNNNKNDIEQEKMEIDTSYKSTISHSDASLAGIPTSIRCEETHDHDHNNCNRIHNDSNNSNTKKKSDENTTTTTTKTTMEDPSTATATAATTTNTTIKTCSNNKNNTNTNSPIRPPNNPALITPAKSSSCSIPKPALSVASSRQRNKNNNNKNYLHRRHPSSVSFAEDYDIPINNDDDSDGSSTLSGDTCDCDDDIVVENYINNNNNNTPSIRSKSSLKSYNNNNNNNNININDIDHDDDDDDDENDDIEDGEIEYLKDYMKTHVTRKGLPRYAIKRLRYNDLSNKMKIEAACDLATEAKFLSSINHPNIVKMRGTVGIPGTPNFMIIMDCLVMTLREKMEQWNTLEKEYMSSSTNNNNNILRYLFKCSGMIVNGTENRKKIKSKNSDIFADKLLAVCDIARAMKYLHSHLIVFRDLKPENVAFDFRGDMRLFDFGLAKEFRSHDTILNNNNNDGSSSDIFEATGLTGSRRYMSPEVTLCKDYGLKTDVYSYAIMIWEVFSGKQAFPFMTTDTHIETVILKGKRPSIKSLQHNKNGILYKGYYPKFPKIIEKLIIDSWDTDPTIRPTFKSICKILVTHAELTTHTQFSDRTAYLTNQSIKSKFDTTSTIGGGGASTCCYDDYSIETEVRKGYDGATTTNNNKNNSNSNKNTTTTTSISNSTKNKKNVSSE